MAKETTRTPRKAKTTFTVKRTASAPVERKHSGNAIRTPIVREATVGQRRRFAAWDVFNVVLGAYLALSPLWLPDAPTGLFIGMGVAAIVLALWAGITASSTLAEFILMVLGVAMIMSPLFHGYTEERTAAGTALFIGAGLILSAAIAGHRNRSGRAASNPFDNENT